MTGRLKKLLPLGLLSGFALLASVSVAQPMENPGMFDPGPLYGRTYSSKITGKLWGGVSNVFFCWGEFPHEVNYEIQSTDLFTGIVVGIGKGAWFTIRRFGLGIADVVTFPIDTYGNNYRSIQRTEFPLIDEVE